MLEILNKGVPEALQDIDADEKIGKGTLLMDMAKAPLRVTAAVIDTTAAATGAVLGVAASVVTATVDVAEDAVDAVEEAIIEEAIIGEETEAEADGEGAK